MVMVWMGSRRSSSRMWITSALPLWKKAIHLRELGITKPILVAGGTLAEQVPLFAEYDLTLTGSSLELLDAAEEVSRSTGNRD